MQFADVDQELSAIPDLTVRYHRWLDLTQLAARQAQTQSARIQDLEVATYIWQYPATLTELEPQARRQWQQDAQTRLDLDHEHGRELNEATVLRKRKKACKNRIRAAWGIEADDILKDLLTTGAGGLGRATLEILAKTAEESQLDQAEAVLQDVVTERIGTQPHVGRSRKQKLTRQDVMETRNRLNNLRVEVRNTEPGAEDSTNVTGRRKRKRAVPSTNSPLQSEDRTREGRNSTAPPSNLLTPRTSHISGSSHSLDDVDMTGEVGLSIS